MGSSYQNPFISFPELSSLGYTPPLIQEVPWFPDAIESSLPSEDSGEETSFPLDVFQTASDKVGVLPGYVNGVMPKIAGTSLDDTTPPTLTIPSSSTRYIIATGTYTPSTFSLGTGFSALGSAGTVVNPSFTAVATVPVAETFPSVSGTTATNGVFQIIHAKIVTDVSGSMTLTQLGYGNMTVLFMPPNMYIAFRNAHGSTMP